MAYQLSLMFFEGKAFLFVFNCI